MLGDMQFFSGEKSYTKIHNNTYQPLFEMLNKIKEECYHFQLFLDGKYVMISMSDSKQADEIYGKFIKNSMKEILRIINPVKLFSSTEIAFTNYKIELKSEE